MRKTIIFIGLLSMMLLPSFAEQREISIEIHHQTSSKNNKDVNRSLMWLPIEIVYDTETHIISVTGEGAIEGEVFLYNADGSLEDHSSTLNTEFMISTSGTYTILIQGDGWYAEGEIVV